MDKLLPAKLKKGDAVRVIAPARSLAIISQELQELANLRFEEMGLHLTFGKHLKEIDDFASSSISSRVEDLHEAFADSTIKAVITVIGGFNSNQLLRYIDWSLIKNNPKIFCGYSDITALNNAILAKTGLITYSGPHYSSCGQKLYLDHTINYFKKCLFSEASFEVEPSSEWSDDPWYSDQNNRQLINNSGYVVINEGEAEGTILGGNLCTFNLLQGTEYWPELQDSVLFIEDDEDSQPYTFDRDLQSLIHQPAFKGVKGIVIGRFQKASKMTDQLLSQIIKSKAELEHIPVIANADFGHTDPKITFPVGGSVKVYAGKGHKVTLTIIEH